MNLLKISQRTKLLSAFSKYPEVVFSPASVGLTCKVSTHTARRVCVRLFNENKIERVRRGFYRLKIESTS